MSAEVLLETLADFPTIRELIGTDWLLAGIAEQDKHPIVCRLLKGKPAPVEINALLDDLKNAETALEKATIMIIIDVKQYDYFILSHLEKCLANLRDEPKINRVVAHLKTKDHFWAGYSEAEIDYLIKLKFGEIELEPTLPNRKSADIKFDSNGEIIYVEVTAPKTNQFLYEVLEETAVAKKIDIARTIADARETIHEENEHFRTISDDLDAIVIINTNRCHYDDLDIEDALSGLPKLVVITNKETGEIHQGWERDTWTVFDEDEKVGLLGGIIAYEREFDITGKVVFKARGFALSFSKEQMETLLSIFSN